MKNIWNRQCFVRLASFLSQKEKNIFQIFPSFSYFMAIIIILISLFLTYTAYQTHVDSSYHRLKIKAERVDRVLTDIFEETFHLMLYLGKEIAVSKNKNLESILDIFMHKYEVIRKSKLDTSWPMFDWVNPKNLQVINRFGIAKKPRNFSSRPYARKVRQKPWSFQLSTPVIGAQSKVWVIPAGMGVTDSEGKFIGIVTTGLQISKIAGKLQRAIDADGVDFLLLDKNLDVVLHSSGPPLISQKNPYKDLIKQSGITALKYGKLSKPIIYKNIVYSFARNIDPYGYSVLIGFDRNFLMKKFLINLGPRLLEIWGVGLLSILALYAFRKRFLRIALLSENSKEAFLKQISQEMQGLIHSIMAHSQILLKHYEGQLEKTLTMEKKTALVKGIYDAAFQMNPLKKVQVKRVPLAINEVIRECVNVHFHSALSKEVVIKQFVSSPLPTFYGDRLHFKQIIIGLLGIAIDRITKRGSIKINARAFSQNQQMYLVIFIEDNGFDLNMEDIRRIREKIGGKRRKNSHPHDINLEFSAIEKLINIHHGTCFLEKNFPYGQRIKMIFPYGDEDLSYTPFQKGEDNVLQFPHKISS